MSPPDININYEGTEQIVKTEVQNSSAGLQIGCFQRTTHYRLNALVPPLCKHKHLVIM